jgi:UPF0755 protein
MSKVVIFIIIFSIIAGTLGFFGYGFYNQFYGVPKDAPFGDYSFEVKAGDNIDQVAQKLENDKVINSSGAFLFWAKTGNTEILQQELYTIKLDKTPPKQVLNKINQESLKIAKLKKDQANRPVVKVTFKEGETLDQIIVKLDSNKLSDKKTLTEFVSNPDNFDKTKYSFLPKPLDCKYGDILSCAKYYPEGYLYPDTYIFFADNSPKEIFEKMLDNFNNRVWQKLKPEEKNKKEDFNKAIIMASVIEKESGRPISGVNKDNQEEVNNERREIAGVFNNRKESRANLWQSDPTGTYWSGKVFCQQTFSKDELKNCIYKDSPEADNLYNTYLNKGYPIGPICNPQFDNIQAALNPKETNNYFFVSDKTGKKYFAETNFQHEKNILEAQRINQKN